MTVLEARREAGCSRYFLVRHRARPRPVGRRQFVIAGALGLGLASQGVLASDAPPVQRPLWTLRKGEGRVHVFGESLPRPVDWHDPEVEALLTRCGHLWTETNQVDRQPVRQLVKTFGMSPSASALKLPTRAQRARLRQAAARCRVSLAELAGARPWLIGATLEDAGYRSAGLGGRSANTVLSAQAVVAGLPGPAAEFVEHERRDHPALYRKLTVDRNRAWIPRIEAMSAEPKPVLVVVGLYHLVGPESLLAQAQQAGFTVSNGL